MAAHYQTDATQGITTRMVVNSELPKLCTLISKQWGPDFGIRANNEITHLLTHPYAAVIGAYSSVDLLLGAGVVVKSYIDYSLWGITWVITDENVRGRGIGTSILNALEQFVRARRCEFPTEDSFIELTTRAPTFYTRLGYESVKILDDESKPTHLMIKRMR